ncbi:MAG: methionyl aminopeptidase [Candidatus Atribacteria bacterium]|nr:methionyl aminopeptidase [Candidatus Atribacteria bacterium]
MAKFTKAEELTKIRESGRILARVLKQIKQFIVPGITTKAVDQMAEELIKREGARPAFKGYRGFPASLCISLNEQVVHGIPSDRKIAEGDLVSIDAGVDLEGFFTDAAFSMVVGRGKEVAHRLVMVTEESLFAGIKQVRSGQRIGDISFAIQKTIERAGFSVVRDFVGHGVGRALHEEPQIPNFGKKHRGPVLEEGMVLAIEPMANEGDFRVEINNNGWTVVTADQKLSAHFEHTVLVTNRGWEILTDGQKKDDCS